MLVAGAATVPHIAPAREGIPKCLRGQNFEGPLMAPHLMHPQIGVAAAHVLLF
jgi:hypothetical protein